MDVRTRSFLIPFLLIALVMVSCTEDPIPVHFSGNPRLELVSDSIVAVGQNGEIPGVLSAHVRPDGQAFIGGYEGFDGGIRSYGMIWTFNGEHWESALDAATRDNILMVTDLHASDVSSQWAVAELKNISPDLSNAILRRDGAAWTDVAPSLMYPVHSCHVVSDDNVWVYGNHNHLYHYVSSAWESLVLPVDSLGTDNVAILSVAANETSTFVLAYLNPTPDSTGRALLEYRNDEWNILYREGSILGAGSSNRYLNQVLLSKGGSVLIFGKLVYGWDGSGIVRLFSPNPSEELYTSAVSPSGNIMAAGANLKAIWTDHISWHNIHLEAPETASFSSIGMNDSLVVLVGDKLEVINDTIRVSETTVMRGILRRAEL